MSIGLIAYCINVYKKHVKEITTWTTVLASLGVKGLSFAGNRYTFLLLIIVAIMIISFMAQSIF